MTYINWLPRVSTIVESVYPFDGNAKKRFERWLSQKWISSESYMKVASEAWTAIHLSLEKHIKGGQEDNVPFPSYVESWKKFLNELSVLPLEIEKYIRTEHYQWTIDLIGEIEGEKWVLDWKTWWIAQTILETKKEGAKYKKNYWKLKKAQLQLSLYAYSEGIEKIGVVELLETGYKFHKLDIIQKCDIEGIINNYYNIWAYVKDADETM